MQMQEAISKTNKNCQQELPSIKSQYNTQLIIEIMERFEKKYNIIYSLIMKDNLFDFTKLDIIKNKVIILHDYFKNIKLIWVLYIDFTCISLNGSLVDACLLSLFVALSNCIYLTYFLFYLVTLPSVEIVDSLPVIDIDDRILFFSNLFIILRFLYIFSDKNLIPLCFTFSIIKTSENKLIFL